MRARSLGATSKEPQYSLAQCRHKSLTGRLKPSDACCPNCASWTDTSAALLRSESERFAVFMVEENLDDTL